MITDSLVILRTISNHVAKMNHVTNHRKINFIDVRHLHKIHNSKNLRQFCVSWTNSLGTLLTFKNILTKNPTNKHLHRWPDCFEPRLRWKSLWAEIWARIFSGSVARLACSVSTNDVAALSIHTSSRFLASAKDFASRNPTSSWRVLSVQRWETWSKRRRVFCTRLRTSTTSCLVAVSNAAVFAADNDEIASRWLSMSCCNSYQQTTQSNVPQSTAQI